ncbi:MAG TPA: SDR family NAD(P)-dependent oxidoreductase [Stellaceae bacterium]|jgi:NAD(P)-dependent dehydrogenase (short-subunit alcohol dehydrogenase family)|nr:SDR family NAD(P)-dependent oxidoreductase [Stellaceae bacterium]
MTDFAGRDLVVTGGTGALGTAVVGALLARGATVHVPWRTKAEADRFPHRGHANVRLVESELADEGAVARLYGGIGALWGSIHIAGGFAMAPIAETDRAAFMAQIEMNLLSCFLASRAAVMALRKTGQGGRIVNVTARPGIEPRHGAGMTAYAASKAAVAAFTQALAAEVVHEHILVNAVAPGTVDTPANRAVMPKADTSKWAQPEEVAATILFLASSDNRVTSGAIVPVYGRS